MSDGQRNDHGKNPKNRIKENETRDPQVVSEDEHALFQDPFWTEESGWNLISESKQEQAQFIVPTSHFGAFEGAFRAF